MRHRQCDTARPGKQPLPSPACTLRSSGATAEATAQRGVPEPAGHLAPCILQTAPETSVRIGGRPQRAPRARRSRRMHAPFPFVWSQVPCEPCSHRYPFPQGMPKDRCRAPGQTPAENAAVSGEASPDRTAPAPWALCARAGTRADLFRGGSLFTDRHQLLGRARDTAQARRDARRMSRQRGSRFWRSSILAFFKHGGTHRKTPGVCQGFSEGQRATIGSVFLNVGLAVSSSGERSPGPTCSPPACRPWHSSADLR